MFNWINNNIHDFYKAYDILASFVLINIVFGTFGAFIYFGRVFIPVADIRKQEELLLKSRAYTKLIANLYFIWPSILRVPAMIKAMFLLKNWWRLLLIIAFTLLIAIPVYYWPLKTGGVTYINDETWVHIQFMCRPVSFTLHLCINATLVRCVGKRTFFMEVGLSVIFLTGTFLQFCLILIGFQ